MKVTCLILLQALCFNTSFAFSPNLPLRKVLSDISHRDLWLHKYKIPQRQLSPNVQFSSTELKASAKKTTKTTTMKKNDKVTKQKQSPTVVSGRAFRVLPSDTKSHTVLADRVCIDFVQTLSSTEGCWIGSSAKVMALVLSEVTESSYVPFRVNAGPIHSYVLLKDGLTTKCLSEIEPGDEILMTDCLDGTSRSIAVGRVTVDTKPCNVINLQPLPSKGSDAEDEAIETAQIFLEHSESVRLGKVSGDFVRSTDIPSVSKDKSSNSKSDGMSEFLLRLSDTESHAVKSSRNMGIYSKNDIFEETIAPEYLSIVDDVYITGIEMTKAGRNGMYQMKVGKEFLENVSNSNSEEMASAEDTKIDSETNIDRKESEDALPDRVLQLWSSVYDTLKSQRPPLRRDTVVMNPPRQVSPQESNKSQMSQPTHYNQANQNARITYNMH